ncbi:MAG: CinA family protein [Nocardioidaceae bacterium]
MTDANEELAAECLALLRRRAETLATAESLTAGLVCSTLAAVSGASDILRGGIAAYATDVKTSVLRVDPELIVSHGVVSAECARAMASGVRGLFEATWSVSTTGVAGPSRQENEPVGTVYVAVAGPDDVHVQHLQLSGSRHDIRESAVTAGLSLLRSGLQLG